MKGWGEGKNHNPRNIFFIPYRMFNGFAFCVYILNVRMIMVYYHGPTSLMVIQLKKTVDGICSFISLRDILKLLIVTAYLVTAALIELTQYI